ncbi:MAG: phosphohistidine phosphatase SixA [Trueperaceae bacterium]|nr:phosphohistidine phosphatase SixA [Trueperaceae bacterium]
MELYIIRHARAAERGPAYPDDSQRPLVDKGHKQATTLARLFKAKKLEFDRLFSSPFTRAAQTASALKNCLLNGQALDYLDALTSDQYLDFIKDLHKQLSTKDGRIGLVGHEPYLSEFASYLLTGDRTSLNLRLKKAGFLVLSGRLEPGAMSLCGFQTYSWYKDFSENQ